MNIEKVLLIILGIWMIWYVSELIYLHSFNIRLFQFGSKIFTKKIRIEFSNWNNLDGIYSEKESKYVFIPELRTGYFVTNFYFYRSHSIIYESRGLPLTIFGKFELIDSYLKIEYRISYRITFFIGIIFLGILTFTIASGNILSIGIGGLFVIVLSAFLYLAYLFQLGRMLIISDEIIKLLKIK
jgi:hypothetical protein